MKKILFILNFLCCAHLALAEKTEKSIEKADVVVFDAVCTPTSNSEGFLTVSLQMRSGDLFIRGEFYSYTDSSLERDPESWYNISLKECQNVQSHLSLQAGRKISLSGHYRAKSYAAIEDVIGSCREPLREGRGRIPCKTGTRLVTRYRQETILKISQINIVKIDK